MFGSTSSGRGTGLVGEFDGRVKYNRPSALWDEKLREDLIRRSRYHVVRWVWAELYPDPGVMLDRISRALTEANR